MLRRSITRAKNILAKDLTEMELPPKDKNQSDASNLVKVTSNNSNHSKEDAVQPSDLRRKSSDTYESSEMNTSTENTSIDAEDSSKYPCPICAVVLSTSHDFTRHIRSHNTTENEQDYTCKICFKILSSNSSLDRHILVHSGERPFRCRVCSVTFNTNGNMHRHMRTHDSARADSCESDGSLDSNNDGRNQQRLENNNNQVPTKRKYDHEEDNSSTKTKRAYKAAEETQLSICPVCEKEEFSTTFQLEQHVESAHPDHNIECEKCNTRFKNLRALNLHRFMKHKDSVEGHDDKSKAKSVVGFSDLTFVDFSTEKFPQIARAACELKAHTPSNGCAGFECSRCSLAFPCSSALEIHENVCKSSSGRSKSVENKFISEDDIKREDFFATLNLQNKSMQIKTENKVIVKDNSKPVSTNHDTKDLADIQSIISMASAKALLKQLSSKPQDSTQECTKENQGEEEAQDLFSAEFRKMKLRGEFPCRLCTAIFPNLRALKGHNRLHLTGNGPGPYRCNMCPHTSTDKAALVRHMRTHNGDRPYECAICNYAFTTKANCERHLRNRHAKVTREEVKRSIVYHPSEDPNNDDLKREQQSSYVQAAPPPSSVFGTPETDPESAAECIPNDRSTPVSHLTPQRPSLNINLPRDLSIVIPQCNLATRILEATQNTEKAPIQKIHVKSLEQLSRIPPYMESEADSEEDDYRPIDLSMDVLDLSKKNKHEEKIESPETPVHSEPHDLSKNGIDFINEQAASAMLQIAQQQHSLKANVAPGANFYAAQLQQWYRGGFPIPPTAFSPFFLPPSSSHPFLTPPSNAQDIASMKELEKEIIRGLQLSGGSLIMNNMALASERLQAFQQQAFNMAVAAKNEKAPININEDLKNPLLVNTAVTTNIENVSPYSPNRNSPISKAVEVTTPTSHSPGAVKMVIKNGVLMPKQKQRRYRTERPFSCEHCSARFTLRSNMERHVKQQHPQHWAQRQRSGGHIVRRGPVAQLHQQSPSNQTEIQPAQPGFNISEQVKYAILAQQLQRSELPAAQRDIDDEDVELVIDEDVEDEKPLIKEEYPKNVIENAKARKVADEILQQAKIVEAAAGVKEKDFDLKIISNLIPRSPMDLSRSESTVPVAEVKNNVNLDGKLAQALSKNMNQKVPLEQNVMKTNKSEEVDLVSVSRLLDNANSQLPFGQFFRNDHAANVDESEGEEEGLVASGSASEGNNSGSDENRSESEQRTGSEKKKSAYSLAPNRVSCNYCHRKFPWSSSLRRHILTHTGQKPYKCAHCPLLFTTKSNCDRHLLRKHGHLAQQAANNCSTALNNGREDANNAGFITRNVPERPYKCASCPSSTFSTISNLKKHMSCKHSQTSSSTEQLSGCSRPNSPSFEAASEQTEKKEKVTDWETQIGTKAPSAENHQPSNIQNSDFPFKCHLCEGSYPERQTALDHIKDLHFEEYELLVSKGAMDAEQDMQGLMQQHEDNDETNSETGKGRFPDYANRKVICAFCMRRFWSAEDLRRHMRTHSGVRPFQCDVCRRRFTLKHSMLRHRKKHDAQGRRSPLLHNSDLACESVAQAGACDSVSETSDEEAKVATTGRPDGDLIGNLLGISDRGMLNKVLFSSAHEAAMLLGVDHRK